MRDSARSHLPSVVVSLFSVFKGGTHCGDTGAQRTQRAKAEETTDILGGHRGCRFGGGGDDLGVSELGIRAVSGACFAIDCYATACRAIAGSAMASGLGQRFRRAD